MKYHNFLYKCYLHFLVILNKSGFSGFTLIYCYVSDSMLCVMILKPVAIYSLLYKFVLPRKPILHKKYKIVTIIHIQSTLP